MRELCQPEVHLFLLEMSASVRPLVHKAPEECFHCGCSLMLIPTATWQPKRATQSQAGWFSNIQTYITHNCRGGHNVLLLSKSHNATQLSFFFPEYSSCKPKTEFRFARLKAHFLSPNWMQDCSVYKNRGGAGELQGRTATPWFSLPYRHSNKSFNGQTCHNIYQFQNKLKELYLQCYQLSICIALSKLNHTLHFH